MTRVTASYLKINDEDKVTWTANMALVFDNGVEVWRGDMKGEFKEAETTTSRISYTVEDLAPGEICQI